MLPLIEVDLASRLMATSIGAGPRYIDLPISIPSFQPSGPNRRGDDMQMCLEWL
jgi:hypothetical protein